MTAAQVWLREGSVLGFIYIIDEVVINLARVDYASFFAGIIRSWTPL